MLARMTIMCRAATLCAAVALLAGCAASPQRFERVALSDSAASDPWEKTNRTIHEISTSIDQAVVVPVVSGYRFIVPEAARHGIFGLYQNLGEPINFANAFAQGKFKSGFRALDRILVNGVLGLGVTDHATEMELYVEEHDFGQTMAVWGVPSGPFVMVPFLGPSTVRDAFGFGVDFIFDPVDEGKNRLLSPEWRAFQLGVRLINIRMGIADAGEQLLTGSADSYATIRSAWLQNRRYALWDGSPPPAEDDWEDDWDTPAAEVPAAEAVTETAGPAAPDTAPGGEPQ